LTDFLIVKGHDVLSAISIDPRSSDEELLRVALAEDRVFVTEDKDFGEIVFVQGQAHGPVVRMVELSVDQQLRAIDELLEKHVDDLAGPAIVTITLGRMRIRRRDS
jgi:predicted nuclease of predicted toxin-antitoxin system